MGNPFSDQPDFLESIRNMRIPAVYAPGDMPDFTPVPRPTAEHAERQIEQGDKQLQVLAAIQQLWEAQAEEARTNAHREAEQQKFNRRMSWTAIILASAAIVVPFLILWIEQSLK
jgi:CHASE3 domain sensor protein